MAPEPGRHGMAGRGGAAIGIAGTHERGTTRAPHAGVLAVGAAVLAVVAGVVALAAARPDLHPLLMDEDRLVEWASVLAYYAAFGAAALRLREGGGRDLLLAGVAAFALLAALDELSFGERLLGWRPPEILGTRLDAAHDLLTIAKKAIAAQAERPYLLAGLLAAGGALAAAAVLAVLVRRGWRLRPGPEAWLVALAALLLAASQVADLKLEALGSRLLGRFGAEEAMEMGGGLALLGFALLRGGGPRSRGQAREGAKPGSFRRS